MRPEGREPLPDKAGKSTLLSRSGGVNVLDFASHILSLSHILAFPQLFKNVKNILSHVEIRGGLDLMFKYSLLIKLDSK